MAKGNVAYYRVSTERQGRSGLGLEAQQSAVRNYLDGGSWKLVAEITEIETGKRADRPQLAEALRLCRLHSAKLIIAKLDRLARNVHFVSTLMESKIDFVAVDFPQANRLTIHILAAVAEHEGKAISERTKEALRMAKERGRVLGGYRGGPPPPDAARRASVAQRQANAKARAADIAPVIAELRATGITSLNKTAAALRERGITAPRGGSNWSPTQVSKLLALLPSDV